MPTSKRTNLRLVHSEGNTPARLDFPNQPESNESGIGDLDKWLFSGNSDGLGIPADVEAFFEEENADWGGTNSTHVSSDETAESAATFSARMMSVLQAAVEGLDCEAAAFYSLDDATTQLTMKAMFGLSATRLLEEPRSLRGSMADLESLCGKAVVLEDDAMNSYWRVPETCGASVCLPVASGSNILGTLWFFCEEARPFSKATTNLMEIVAGRIACEIELDDHRRAHEAGLWSWKA